MKKKNKVATLTDKQKRKRDLQDDKDALTDKREQDKKKKKKYFKFKKKTNRRRNAFSKRMEN
jgi:hypothetical protein